MKKAAAHCNPKVKPELNHNDRTNDRAKTITKELSYKNEYSCSSDEVRIKIDKLYNQAFENFSKFCENKNGLAKSGKPKGLQNFTKKEKSYHEFIYEIDEKTTMQQCQELTEKIADLTGFTPLQVVIHRDEVFENAKGETQTHYHAHAVFFTLDKETGLQLARQEASLHKGNLSKIQDLTAQTLGMKRGENRLENGEKQPQYIQDYKIYAQFKEQTKEKEKELLEIERKLTETAQILKEKEKEIEIKAKELKLKFEALEKQEKDYKDRIERLEQTHRDAFGNLERDFKKQKNVLKNILTLGFHNKKVEQNYQIAKSALQASAQQAEREAQEELRKVQRELQNANQRMQEYQRQGIEYQKEIKRLKQDYQRKSEYSSEYYKKMKEYEEWLKKYLRDEDLIQDFPELAREKQQEQEQQQRNSYQRFRSM